MDWNNGMGWHNGMGWGGWLGMGVLMILFSGLVVWGIVALVRYAQGPDSKTSFQTQTHEATTSSDEILAKRFARGEIGEEEYKRRLAILRSPVRPAASSHHTEGHGRDETVA